MKVTNTTTGPKGVNTSSGPLVIEAGQTVDVEMSKGEQAMSAKTGWFAFDDAKAAKAAAADAADTTAAPAAKP